MERKPQGCLMVIQHNLLAMNAQRQFNITGIDKAKTTEKLSSGYRINRAADDAAGLAISEKMRWMINGLHQGTRNTYDGISFVQIGDGAMGEIHDMLNRIEELAVHAANGTLTDVERGDIDTEVQHLKKQINKISTDTVFNELQIFDNSSFINVNGTPNDMSFFDSHYDDATGDFEYGGFIFNGERVSWDKAFNLPDLYDSETNLFKGGTYNYTDSTGTTFTLRTQKDGDIPEFTRSLQVSAGGSGVTIDGNTFSWDQLVDESGEKCSADNVHAGTWLLDYKGAEVALFVSNDVETLDELGAEIDRITNTSGPVYYVWDEEYVGDAPKQAVDVTTISGYVVSPTLADALIADPSFALTVSADETGISLKDKNGKDVPGSKQTWDDMGITSWDSGTSISEENNYTYKYQEGGVTVLSFNYHLANETSKDSVIDGLNGMKINSESIMTYYATSVSLPGASGGTLSAAIKNTVRFDEEYALGRPFNTPSGTLATENIGYASGTKTAILDFVDGSHQDVIRYEGNTAAAETKIASTVDKYWNKIANVRLNSALLGADYSARTINDVVGAGNITDAGYFSSVITMNDATMHKSDGEAGYKPGEDGKNYASAFIDFKNLNSADKLNGLVGTGFDSTCKSCSNHYSVVFTNDVAGGTTSPEGYVSKMSRNGSNYVLEVDVYSLTQNGVTDGEKFAKAFVDIASKSFDFHFTQYASEGSKLYIYDNRSQNTEAKSADFWTVPFDPDKEAKFDIGLSDKSGDGDYMQLGYTYDVTGLDDKVVVISTKKADGKYIKNSDLNPSAKGYSEYDATNPAHASLDRYDVEVGYQNADGSLASSKAEAVASNAAGVVKDLLSKTTVTMDYKDYTKIATSGNEKSNVAIAPVYMNNIYRVGEDENIYIYHSGIAGDRTGIPRYAMNTAAMGMAGANTKTIMAAEKTIGSTKLANDYVNHCRSNYGAIQNRLEHTVRNNENKEENMTAAESRIRDADMAKLMVQLSIQNVLEQAGLSMLSQANQKSQSVLSLLS